MLLLEKDRRRQDVNDPASDPSIQRIARVATALKGLVNEVVFIGGSIAPLLHTDSPFSGPRPTKDADAVTASTSYYDLAQLHERLRSMGFSQSPGDAAHIHRWVTPDGDLFDLTSAGEHPGGTGQVWDQLALETAVITEIVPRLTVRHASAPAFLALKWAAHNDRGAKDPFGSRDLEDILALVAARPALIEEVRVAPERIRLHIATQTQALLRKPELPDLLAAHLNNAQEPAKIRERVRQRLEQLAVSSTGLH
jgi:predicted nucleotidyltransferase